ncbi:hypothetical protein LCGC14_2424550, partial [marine sediment metagenome]
VFRGVDPSVRDALKIEYKEVQINDLFEIQFLIANTGERPIRDIIRPLTLHVPEGSQILDASILYTHPKGREVSISVKESNAIFYFALLNSDEFFIAKILLDGVPKEQDFKFSISVDDLPPTLKQRFLPPDLVDTGDKRKFKTGSLIGGIVCLALGSSLAGLIYAQWPTISALWGVEPLATLKQNWLILVSAAITAAPALLLIVLGPMLAIGAFTNFSFPKKRKFPVPSDYIRRPFRFYPYSHLHIEDESMMANHANSADAKSSAAD